MTTLFGAADVGYNCDDAGRLARISRAIGGKNTESNLTYDPDGWRTSL
jgi:YD repeat-containing protein